MIIFQQWNLSNSDGSSTDADCLKRHFFVWRSSGNERVYMRFLNLPDFKNIQNMMKFPGSLLLIPLCEKDIHDTFSSWLTRAFTFTASLPMTQFNLSARMKA